MDKKRGRWARHVGIGVVGWFAFVLTFAFGTGTAHACSCAGNTPLKNQVADSDVSFTGRLTSSTVQPDLSVQLTFDVVTVVKGTAGPTALVLTPQLGGGCGVLPNVGELIGVITQRRNGQLTTTACSTPADPVALTAPGLLDPPSAAPGAGVPAVFGVGRDGAATVVASDDQGRLAGAGVADDRPQVAAVCPGGHRLVTVGFDDVVVFDAVTLTTLSTVPAARRSDGSEAHPDALRCLDAGATRLVWSYDDQRTVGQLTESYSVIVHLGPAGLSRIDLPSPGLADIDPTGQLALVKSGGLELRSAETGTVIASMPFATESIGGARFDSDGNRVAILSVPQPPPVYPELPVENLRVVGVSAAGFGPVPVPSAMPKGALYALVPTLDGTWLALVNDFSSTETLIEFDDAGKVLWSTTSSVLPAAKFGDSVYGAVASFNAPVAFVRVDRAGTIHTIADGAQLNAVVVVPPVPASTPTPPASPTPTPSPTPAVPRFTG